MEQTDHCITVEQGRIKSAMENELLIKIGAKKEEFDWHRDITERISERPKSCIRLEYPLDIKLGRPKLTKLAQNRNPWSCGNQALRQMTMTSRHGPRILYFSRKSTSSSVDILKIS